MITAKTFGKLPSGDNAVLYSLVNESGSHVDICNYGGILVSIVVPDTEGKAGDVLLGCKTVEDYIPNNGYLGALIGRVGNRIGKGRCVLNGKQLVLAQNNGENHLHGGDHGFNEKVWDARTVPGEGEDSLVLTTVSEDGEENYPGRLEVKVTYTFTDKNELKIHYEAVSDKDTLCNLTNHAYFNIGGEGGDKITGEYIQINADAFTPTDAALIPTGELRCVEGTPFDLRKPVRIGDRIDDKTCDQLVYGQGYDHNFCLNGTGLREAAVVTDPKSGRVMKVYTDLPGVQFYAGNCLDGTMKGKCGRVYTPRDALCLETQNYPDAVNHPEFPDAVLKAGEKYDHTTIYAFSVTD